MNDVIPRWELVGERNERLQVSTRSLTDSTRQSSDQRIVVNMLSALDYIGCSVQRARSHIRYLGLAWIEDIRIVFLIFVQVRREYMWVPIHKGHDLGCYVTLTRPRQPLFVVRLTHSHRHNTIQRMCFEAITDPVGTEVASHKHYRWLVLTVVILR